MRFLLIVLVVATLAAAPPSPGLFQRALSLDTGDNLIGSVAVSADGKYLAAACGNKRLRVPSYEIRLWDLGTGTLTGTWTGLKQAPSALAFSPDGKTLVSVDSSMERIHWNVAAGKAEQTHRAGRYGYVQQMAFSKDGKQIGAVSGQDTIIWDATTGKEVVRHNRKFTGYSGAFSRDLSLLASPHHQDVDLYDNRTGKLVRSLLDHRGRVQDVSFSGDAKQLAVVCMRGTDEREDISEVWLWDVPGERRKRVIELGKMYCRQVVLSPGGNRVAVVGSDFLNGSAQLRLFETKTGAELGRLQPAAAVQWLWLGGITFLPGGELLAAGHDGTALQVWKTRASTEKVRSR